MFTVVEIIRVSVTLCRHSQLSWGKSDQFLRAKYQSVRLSTMNPTRVPACRSVHGIRRNHVSKCVVPVPDRFPVDEKTVLSGIETGHLPHVFQALDREDRPSGHGGIVLESSRLPCYLSG